jgi:hypothetical protein
MFGDGGSAADAQTSSPFIPGDTISLQYNGAPPRRCEVEAVAGQFIKCRHPEDQTWYNLNATLLVLRCSPVATAGCK